MAAFMEELELKNPPVAVTMQSPQHDGTGRYQFNLHRGIRAIPVDMPGLPLDEVRCTDTYRPPKCPRMYVDGNSWLWCFALSIARECLEDHDGTIEQRRNARERAANLELDQQPRCVTCGAVRSLVRDSEDFHAVCCYICSPKIEMSRETFGGAVYGDESWKGVSHYLVKRQYMPPEVPGHENPMHPDALCGARFDNDRCRLRRRHEGRCEPYRKEIERILVEKESSCPND